MSSEIDDDIPEIPETKPESVAPPAPPVEEDEDFVSAGEANASGTRDAPATKTENSSLAVSSSQDHPSAVQAPTDTNANLETAFNRLASTDTGSSIAQTIQDQKTTCEFGKTRDDAIAQYDRAKNKITISESEKDASPAVLAAHLAHEGTHAGWDQPCRTDLFDSFAEDYVNEEYHAFLAQDQVWQMLKGEETDKQCDWVSALIGKGEADAKAEIRQMYFNNIAQAWKLLTSNV